MPLQVWLPLVKDAENQGLSGITMQGSPDSWVDGKLGKAAHFVGNTSNVIYNNTTDFNYTDNFSYAFWIKPNFTSGSTQYAFTVGRADMGGYGYGCNVASATQINVRFGSVLIAVTGCNSGTWYHIAVTISNNKIKTYKDGALFNTSNVGTIPTYSDGRGLGVGCFHYTNNIYPYYGDLCDFRIYDHALSPKEIKLLSQGLVCHYKLSDDYIENTTNLTNVQFMSAGTSGGWGGHSGVVTIENRNNAPIPSGAYNKIVITYAGSGGGGWGRAVQQSIAASPSTTYTYSCYIKSSIGYATRGVANLLYKYELDSTGTKITEGGVFSSSRMISLGDGWYRCWGTFTTTSTTAKLNINFYTYPDSDAQYLVGCWQLEQNDHMTPYVLGSRSENLIYDCSGYNYHGETMTTTMTCSSDTPRNLISTHFNGTYDGVIINNLTLSGIINSAVTYSFWIKPESEAGARSIYFGSFASTSWSIEKDTSNLLRLYWNGSPDEHCTGATITDGVWQHICITKNGTSDVKVYINGVQKWTSTATHPALTFPTTYRIGRDTRSNDGTPYKGLMSDFRIYATALSAEDVLALYNTPESIANNGTVITQGEFVEV